MNFKSLSLCGMFVVLLLVFGLLPASCDNAVLPEVPEPEFCDTLETSYNLNIRPIVETYCSYSGCHDGSSPGVYLTYNGMLPNLNSGEITERVLIARDMPPDYANEGLRTLPEQEFGIFECWVNEGYPEE